jgi:hypothetical protein
VRKTQQYRDIRRGAFAYLQQVPCSGYGWDADLVQAGIETTLAIQEGKRSLDPGPWLVGPQMGAPYAVTTVPSLTPRYREDPGLHRAFARLDGSKERILRFANRYGNLGIGEPLAPAGGGAMQWGESLSAWRREITEMRTLLFFWDLVLADDQRGLSRFFLWRAGIVQLIYVEERGQISEAFTTSFLSSLRKGVSPLLALPAAFEGNVVVQTVLDPDTSPDPRLLERWRKDDPIEPARYHVHREVNKKLQGAVSPAVFPYVDPPEKIMFFPHNLLSALYLLFALELSGEKFLPRTCGNERCPNGGWFVPRRKDQKYCNTYCRKQASDIRTGRAGAQ